MDSFDSPKRQLRKAVRKTHQFWLGERAYLNGGVAEHVIESDAKSGCDLHKLKVIKFPPDELTDLAYDIIDAQRSTLDQIAYACAVLSGVLGRDLERIAFPISRDPAQFESSIASGCQGLHPDIVNLFRSYQAHPGGNTFLADLNAVRRQGHHRIVVPVGTASNIKMGLGYSAGKKIPPYIPGPVWNHEKHELVYRASNAEGSFGYDSEVTFRIAFGEVEAVGRKPVFEFLLASGNAVEKVLNETEECARLIWP